MLRPTLEEAKPVWHYQSNEGLIVRSALRVRIGSRYCLKRAERYAKKQVCYNGVEVWRVFKFTQEENVKSKIGCE